MSDKIKTEFLNEVKDHTMEIVLDGGWCHIKFSNKGSSIFSFSLVTWPGFLCICGDVGTFVFHRHDDDMFNFFRSPDMSINPSYWSEKLEATECDGGHESFSKEKFEDAVRDHFDSCFYLKETAKDKALRQTTWEAIEHEVLNSDAVNEHAARELVDLFEFRGFRFHDFYEYNIMYYTGTYLWCLYAIVWGINKYDEDKK